MLYFISPLSPEYARCLIEWRYDPPYDLYDLGPEHLSGLLNPDYRYHQILDDQGQLTGFCCFGEDARVPGGKYGVGEPEVLDLGVGLKPELTGRGQGIDFVEAVLNFADDTFQPDFFRVTVADFNQRSMRTFLNLGFSIRHQFTREFVDLKFTQLDRPVEKELT